MDDTRFEKIFDALGLLCSTQADALDVVASGAFHEVLVRSIFTYTTTTTTTTTAAPSGTTLCDNMESNNSSAMEDERVVAICIRLVGVVLSKLNVNDLGEVELCGTRAKCDTLDNIVKKVYSEMLRVNIA